MPSGTFLSGRAPTRLRGLQWLTYRDTGTLWRGTVTSDSGGGATGTWAASSVATWGTAIPCRIDAMSGDESLAAGRLDDRSTHVVQTPAGVPVRNTDRFAIANRGTFEVTAVREWTGESARFFEVTSTS